MDDPPIVMGYGRPHYNPAAAYQWATMGSSKFIMDEGRVYLLFKGVNVAADGSIVNSSPYFGGYGDDNSGEYRIVIMN